MTAGIVVALLAGFVAFSTLSNVTRPSEEPGIAGPSVDVVVASRAIPIRNTLTVEDVEIRAMPVALAPDGYLSEVDSVVGRITLVDLFSGEAILDQRILDPNVVTGDGRLALVMVEDEVLMAIPAQDLMSRMEILKPGDRVDLLFSLNFPTERVADVAAQGAQDELSTFNLLQNVAIAAFVGGEPVTAPSADNITGDSAPSTAAVKDPAAVLLTVNPQDALVLKYALDAGGIIDVVLRPPGVERTYEVDPVDVDFIINRYDIPIEVGR